ncbi:MAG: nuclear transport factor 2 family protein [Chitinophagaceae bacterium]
MKLLSLFVIVVFFIVPRSFGNCNNAANSNEDSVKQVIERMFTAMKNSDTALLLSCFHSNAILQTVAVNKEGTVQVRNEKIAEFVQQVGSMPAQSADERITFEKVLIDGNLASVWTPYSFYFKGTFSHCGVNSFQLVRVNNEWKIQYCIDTRRRKGCKE